MILKLLSQAENPHLQRTNNYLIHFVILPTVSQLSAATFEQTAAIYVLQELNHRGSINYIEGISSCFISFTILSLILPNKVTAYLTDSERQESCYQALWLRCSAVGFYSPRSLPCRLQNPSQTHLKQSNTNICSYSFF